MSLTRSHLLHKQTLRFSQVNVHRRKILLEQRQAAYDLRDSTDKKYRSRIKSARTGGDNALALALEERWAQEYKKVKAIIDRFNLYSPINVHEANSSDLGTHQRQALLTDKLDLISSLELSNPAVVAALAISSDEIPSPPGEAIRSTPHRPGAPFSLLPH